MGTSGSTARAGKSSSLPSSAEIPVIEWERADERSRVRGNAMRFALGGAERIDRRTMLVAGGLSLFGFYLPPVLGANRPRVAKSTIHIWLSGGASHIDTWDLKPDAPSEYRGVFRPTP